MSKCYGILMSDAGKADRTKRGHRYMTAHVKTWRTTILSHIYNDGSGFVEITRGGTKIHSQTFGPEENPAENLGKELLSLPARQRNKIIKMIQNNVLVEKMDKVI